MLLMLLIAFIIVIVVYFLANYFSKKKEKEDKEFWKKRCRMIDIKNKYPNAYSDYWGEVIDFGYGYSFQGGIYTANESLGDNYWEVLEKKSIAAKEEKREIEKKKKADKCWEEKQTSFTNNTLSISNEALKKTFGYYTYTYDITTKVGSHLKMKTRQFFIYGTCLENDLDYTYNQATLKNTKGLPQNQKNGIFLTKTIKDKLYNFIKMLPYKNVVVFFNEDIEGWSNDALSNTYTDVDIPDEVKLIDVSFDIAMNDYSMSGRELLSQQSPDCVIVIDAFTDNDNLKKNCEYIFNTLQDKKPCLVYISIFKAYDRKEMLSYIDEKRKEAQKREAEEKEKEEERVRLQASAKDMLINNAKKWEHLYDDLYYTWLFYYYPITCDFDASDSEWDDRRTVWNFKNDPDKNISSIQHEKALENVIPRIRQRLCETFGEEYLQFLTLVCLPASTNVKNVARYDDFSKWLCEETGMANAYNHVHIIKDGMSKRDPRNITGKSIQPEVCFDDWFSDKYILLFDDVITKGDTMLRYKYILEQKGATVIGGFCIGKTKHERPLNDIDFFFPNDDNDGVNHDPLKGPVV